MAKYYLEQHQFSGTRSTLKLVKIHNIQPLGIQQNLFRAQKLDKNQKRKDRKQRQHTQDFFQIRAT